MSDRTEQGRALVAGLKDQCPVDGKFGDDPQCCWYHDAALMLSWALDRIATLEGALREVDEELWDNGGQDVAYLRDRIASVLTPQPAKEDA